MFLSQSDIFLAISVDLSNYPGEHSVITVVTDCQNFKKTHQKSDTPELSCNCLKLWREQQEKWSQHWVMMQELSNFCRRSSPKTKILNRVGHQDNKKAHESFMQRSSVLLYPNTLLRAHMPSSPDSDDDPHDNLSVTALQRSHRSEETFYMQWKPLVVKVSRLCYHTDCLSDLSCYAKPWQTHWDAGRSWHK